MSRILLLAGLALLATPPASAQTAPDAETRQLIERLRPGEGQTRGIRMPSADPGVGAASPAPGVATPSAPGVATPSAPGVATPSASGVATPSASGGPAPQAAARPSTTAPAGAPAVSITVNFGTGSATLTPKSEQSLNALGRALASADLAPFGFRIEGHTDTVGDAAQNEQLSRRRAEAVRDYLVKRHGIASSRLNAVGLGESQLLVATPDQVAEPRNRRVQVVNTGG